MTYPTAYRSARALAMRGMRGFQPQRIIILRMPTPWAQVPNVPLADYPSEGRYRLPSKHYPMVVRPMPLGWRLQALALRGISIAARFHPLYRFIEAAYWLHWLYQRYAFGWVIPNGWQLEFSCGPGFWSPIAGNFCPLPGQGEPSPNWPNCINNGSVAGQWEYTHTTAFGFPRFKFLGRWRYSGPQQCGPTARPQPYVVNPRLVPRVPMHNPEYFLPSPVLPWRMVPYQRPNPMAPRPIRREAGPLPQPASEPIPRVNPRDPFAYPPPVGRDILLPAPRPLPSWWPQPGRGIVPRPSSPPRADPVPGERPVENVPPAVNPNPVLRPPSHRFAPPRPREKERKPKLAKGWFGAFRRATEKAVSNFTEWTELVDCAYGALPEKVRKREAARRYGKQPSHVNKLKLIKRYVDSLNVTSFVKCFLANQLEDALIGRAAKAHQQLRKQYGIRGGYLSRMGLPKLSDLNLPK